MFGAGRRKIRPPARSVSSPAEDELEWQSTPAELSKRLENELLDVTRQLEKMKADIDADLERARGVRTPLPNNAFEDDDGGQRSPIPEIPAQSQDGRTEEHTRAPRAEVRAPDPSARHSFPTLREVWAFHQLQSDHAEFLRHVPRHTEGEQWGAAGHPPPPKYQANTCTFATDLISALGTLHVHACKFCARNRPEVDADHPAKFCPEVDADHPAKFCPYNRDTGGYSNQPGNSDNP
uniref:Uncharacterized protein n=1 Tax=Branchiostoma floridae TaxID=7739 RepID=C3YWA1_BRAFL|eukprot:XP_002599418.1 hypothetical protein BRAFLDRAFT_106561 [Branchiostoma floridae]